MGVVSNPFGVDMEKVRQSFGSKDERLFERAKSTHSYAHYAGQHKAGEYEQALREIIFKYIKPEDRKEKKSLFGLMKSTEGSGLNMSGDVYGYALCSICEALGTQLAPEGDVYYMGDDFDRTNDYLNNMGFKVTMKRFEMPAKLFDIPGIRDWPVINAFTKEEVAEIYDAISKLTIADPDDEESEDPGYDPELLQHFKSKLKVCVDNHYDWISFAH